MYAVVRAMGTFEGNSYFGSRSPPVKLKKAPTVSNPKKPLICITTEEDERIANASQPASCSSSLNSQSFVFSVSP